MKSKWLIVLSLISAVLIIGCNKNTSGAKSQSPEQTTYEKAALSNVPAKYLEPLKESLKLAGDNKPELLKVLKELSTPEERDGAAFLMTTMSYPDLVAIKSVVLMEHIRYAYLAKNKYQWFRDMPEEVFLHYVLPYRCAEEPIESYRKYFYEQLDPIISQLTNMDDVAHQVNLWLGSPKPDGKQRVRFVQTEARDQGPLETLKSGYGRCEEMMIIYMSAARSAGIPCRSAWTPYWAICDNNHAWVEVWIDGHWKPLGGCEPGTPWFGHPAKRAAAVYSATIGKPQSELIHKTMGNTSIINSTPNYSRTCKVNVSVVDENNKPVTDTTVVFAVFNWGSFRPFATKPISNTAVAEFTTGIGEYFLSTGKDDYHAWQIVKTEPDKTLDITLKLAKNSAPDGYLFLRYPTVEQAMKSFTVSSISPAYLQPLTPAVNAPPEIYFYDEFSPTMHSDVMSLLEEYPQKDAIIQKLISAGGNWPQIAGAIKEINPELKNDLLWMVSQLAHLEAIEVTKKFLLDNVRCASEARQRADWQIPDDIYRPYVLNPQFEYLHISNWRKELKSRFILWKKDKCIETDKNKVVIAARTITETAQSVNNWVSANIKLRDDISGRFSYVASPLDTLRSKVGEPYGIALFTAALLRTLGVPAQVKNDWVEFYDGSKWLPLYPLDPKNLANTNRDEKTASEYNTKPAGIKFNLTRRGVVDTNPWEKVAVSRFQNSYWQYLDWDDLKRYGKWMALQPGQYLVTAGVRNSNGDVMAYCKQLEFKPGEGIVLNTPMDIPLNALSETERIIRPLKEIPDVTLAGIDDAQYNLKATLQRNNVILTFFSLDNEPSLRMLPMIDNAISSANQANTLIWGVYIDPEGKNKFLKDERLKGLRIPILIDADQKAVKQFIPDFEKNKATVLPSTILISKAGKVVIWDEGYNMDIERLIESGLGLLPEGKISTTTVVKEPEISREPFNVPDQDYLAQGDQYFKAGKYQDAIVSYKKAMELMGDDAGAWYNIACSYSLLKQADEGLDALKKAIDFGWSEFHWMNNDPDLQNLRNDPRYKKIKR